nr:hypothetical protein [Tanacetum cinerariifolium]
MDVDQIVPTFPAELICKGLGLLVPLLESNRFGILFDDQEEVREDDDEDPEEDPADYLADHDDEEEEKEPSRDDVDEKDEEQDEDDDDEEEEHPASADSIPPPPALRVTAMVGESSVAVAARPIEGRRADYGFVDSVEAEIRRRRVEDIGYGIRDTWIDPRDVAEEEALTTLEGVNTRVTELAAVQEHDTQDIYGVMEDTQGLSSAVHFELQGYMTHMWVQDKRIDAQDTGHLATALGEIRAL